MIDFLFPHKLHLHILQLERYKLGRTWAWLVRNPLARQLGGRSGFVWTAKARFLWRFGYLVTICGVFALWFFVASWIIGAIGTALLVFVPIIPLSLAVIVRWPYEFLNKKRVIKRTRRRLQTLGIPVISITGSYGKTSVKNMLVALLRSQYDVLTTPKSYNTIFGIADVVDLEADKNYDFFVAEIGAFKKGDIKELAYMVNTTHGILTGITPQHLERFGSLETIVNTKFELCDEVEQTEGGTCFVNVRDENVATRLLSHPYECVTPVPTDADAFSFTVGTFDPETLTTAVTIQAAGRAHQASTQLAGEAHLRNLELSCFVAYSFGVPLEKIAKTITTMKQVHARFEVSRLPDGYVVINNGYSSNVASFQASLATLAQLPFKNRVLVTPGLVELGDQEDTVHQQLSAHIEGSEVTQVIFVRPSARTSALSSRLQQKAFQTVDSIHDVWPMIQSLELEPHETVVLFENDLPDNY